MGLGVEVGGRGGGNVFFSGVGELPVVYSG